MNSALVVVCVCGIIYFVVMLNFAFIERKALEGRECLSECDLKHIFNTDEVGMTALNQIAAIYSIKIGYLRPSDKLGAGGMLDNYNSWGTDYLNDFLAEHGVFEINGEWQLADFISWYQSHFKAPPSNLW